MSAHRKQADLPVSWKSQRRARSTHAEFSNPSQGLRLPAYLRELGLDLQGRRPSIGGGRIAVLTHSAIPCPMVHLVCPKNVPIACWDLSYLRGVEILVLYRPDDKSYASELCAALTSVGCACVVASAVAGVAP